MFIRKIKYRAISKSLVGKALALLVILSLLLAGWVFAVEDIPSTTHYQADFSLGTATNLDTSVNPIRLSQGNNNGSLVSQAIDTGYSRAKVSSVSWETQGPGQTIQPSGTEVKFQVASSTDGNNWSQFVGPNNTTISYFTNASGHGISYPLNRGRYFKYKAYFSKVETADSPLLYSVTLNYYQTVSDIASTAKTSTDSSGTSGNNNSYSSSISADGRYVAYESDASNLVAGDTNGIRDIFLKGTQTGTTTRVSTNSSGNQSNGTSYAPSISTDGRYVAFESWASNLVASDTNGWIDIFVKDTQAGTTTRVSADLSASQGNNASYNSAISADGRYVAFESFADNLVADDTNASRDIFLKDTETGTTTRVSTDSSENEANNPSLNASISSDGRYVAFESDASNLVAGDNNGFRDIFVKDTQTGNTTRVSTDSSGNETDSAFGPWAQSINASISADGRYVAFQSGARNLVANNIDTGLDSDIFVKDTLTGSVVMASTNAAGEETYSSTWPPTWEYYGIYSNYNSINPSISADGRYVAFQSRDIEGLLGLEWWVNYPDIFLKDLANNAIIIVNTNSDGVQGFYGGRQSFKPSIAADGSTVAYESDLKNLVEPEDSDSYYDIFATKVNNTQNSLAPTVTSQTHASNSTYYSNNDPSFSFSGNFSREVGYSYTLDQLATTAPDTLSEGTTTKSYTDLADGTWYFHLRAAESFKEWSNPTHYQVRIDTQAPEISAVNASVTDNRWQRTVKNPAFTINAIDNGISGIKNYVYYWGTKANGAPVRQSSSSSIRLKATRNGKFYFRVKAQDRADNSSGISQFIFKYDRVAPYLNARFFSKKRSYRGRIKLWANASDWLSGLKRIYFFIDKKLIYVTASSKTSFTWNSSRYKGRHVITARAIDNAGNRTSYSQRLYFNN